MYSTLIEIYTALKALEEWASEIDSDRVKWEFKNAVLASLNGINWKISFAFEIEGIT